MDDLISRKAAYTTLTDYYHHTTEIQHKALREALERVPSAETHEEHTETHACDLIDRQAAIDTLDKHLRTTDVPVSYPGIISALTEWLNELPSAQADSKELSFTHKALDTISRKAAIDAVGSMLRRKFGIGGDLAEITLAGLPSAQADVPDTNVGDTISRQAAIDAHYEYCNKHPDAGFPVWSLKILEYLPSAQPERRWIPCSLRLPKEEGWYITTIENEKTGRRRIENDLFAIGIAEAHGNTPYKFCKDGYRQKTIAWMPLPEPYREGEG